MTWWPYLYDFARCDTAQILLTGAPWYEDLKNKMKKISPKNKPYAGLLCLCLILCEVSLYLKFTCYGIVYTWHCMNECRILCMFHMCEMTYHTCPFTWHVPVHMTWLCGTLAHYAGMFFTGACFVTCLPREIFFNDDSKTGVLVIIFVLI